MNWLIKYKETLKRAGRTFLQAVVGYVASNLVYIFSANTSDFDYLKTAVIGLLASAGAAGIAALMNMPKKSEDESEG